MTKGSDEAQILAAATGIDAEDATFDGTVALGVQGVPGGGETTWALVEFEGGVAKPPRAAVTAIVDPEATVEAADEPVEELDVKLWVSAGIAAWDRAGASWDDFLEVIGHKTLLVVGEVPYFIRHTEALARIFRRFASNLNLGTGEA